MKQFNSQEVRDNIQVPGEMKAAMERLVVAGQKLLYSEQLQSQVQEHFSEANKDPDSERLSQAAFVLIGAVYGETNGNMPPDLIVPAGVYLLTEVADFVEEAGLAEIDDSEMGEALAMFVGMVVNMAEELDAEGSTEGESGPMQEQDNVPEDAPPPPPMDEQGNIIDEEPVEDPQAGMM